MKKIILTLAVFSITILCFSQNVGIGSTTPLARLHVSDSNVVFTGPTTLPTSTNFNPPLQGAGTRMLWYPQKGAFRIGVVDGTQWDKNNIGRYSFAAGNNTRAVGHGSVAMGDNTIALSDNAFAMGTGVSASAYSSVAMNFGTSASGPYSTAIGLSTIAGGNTSIAMGRGTKAFGDRSTAMGDSTFASGTASTAIGYNTKAQGLASFAGGGLSTASGIYSTALGNNATASGYYSTALGNNTSAQGQQSTAIGYSSVASGITSIAIGHSVRATGDRSIALGDSTLASGPSSIAMGLYTKAWQSGSFAAGISTIANGIFSTAMGNSTTAQGDQSTAFGNLTLASGASSMAMGVGTNASGLGSVAMNVGTTALGIYSTAMGQSTIAAGNTSIAMGRFTKAFGDRSIAMGDSTFASGTSSAAMGLSTKAKSPYSLVAGMYNDTSYAGFSLFEVGNGSSNNTRRNAMTVSKDGQVRIEGPPTESGIASLSLGSYGDVVVDKPGLWGGRFIVKENGYVGIGMAIPGSLLHTGYGTVRIEGQQTVGSGASLSLGGWGDVVIDRPGTVGGRFMIKENGNVGINKANPTVKLDIASSNSEITYSPLTSLGIENWGSHYISMLSNNGNSGIVFGNTLSNTDGGIIYNSASAPTDPRSLNFTTAGGVTRMKILSNGNAWLSGSLSQSSDARLKKNILPLSNSLTSIQQINGYTYNWKDENRDKGQQIGVLAQELQKIYPQLVKENSNGELSVNYTGLIPVLVEGMKEQQRQIEELKLELKKLTIANQSKNKSYAKAKGNAINYSRGDAAPLRKINLTHY